ncbi:aromatic acid exporter family protein [Arthrobacter sp.]|uniref:aromatic acid exporter family protein n=1 Tax=Arthrobacter sp. TaxID=1667 RepID=UPI00258BFD82|nr:aromatic acid exporter family protein [Arthrobacter sp.]
MSAKARAGAALTRVKSSVAGQRVLLAAKTALAVGFSWFLASRMPGAADKYAYYAPLGALVSMYPTFMGSVRIGLQTLVGLSLGIVLAVGVLALGSPSLVSISIAVGLGVLLGGLPKLGAGREYVPVATLLVLIIGGRNADAFSFGYAAQMGLGVVVGLLVNVTIFPPLTLDAAQLRISRGRNVLIGQLEDAARALLENWPPKHEDWGDRQHVLSETVTEIRAAVHRAHESHKANPRAYRGSRHRNVAESFDDLAVLENVTFHVRDLTEVLAGAIWGGPFDVDLKPELCAPMSDCLQAVADVLAEWEHGSIKPEMFDGALESLNGLTSALDEHSGAGASSLSPGAAVALDVQRILVSLRRRLFPEEART